MTAEAVEVPTRPTRPMTNLAELAAIERVEHRRLAKEFCPDDLTGRARKRWVDRRADLYAMGGLRKRLANAREQERAHRTGQRLAHEALIIQQRQVARAATVAESTPTIRNQGNLARQTRMEQARADAVAEWGAAALAWEAAAAQLRELISECERK